MAHRTPTPLLPLWTVASLLVLAGRAEAANVVNPDPSLLSLLQREDPTWVEHYPLANAVSWELLLRNGVCGSGNQCLGGQTGASCSVDSDCPSSSLTFTGGTARYLDENGVVVLQLGITPGRFRDIATDAAVQTVVLDGNGNAVVPPNSNLFVPFSAEFLPMNFVPAKAEMDLCFDELEAIPGACANPVQVLDVTLQEYVAPEAPSYIFPLVNPSQPDNSDGSVFVGGNGHEIGTRHRLARNQRYAYDVGVRVDGSNRKSEDGTNSDFYIYEDFIVAPGDGVITVSDQDFPDNTPGSIPTSVGACRASTCFQTPMCQTGEIPGGGNMVVMDHRSGEYSFLAHMIPGTNNATSCGAFFDQGDVLGLVGNSGSSSGPHLHFSTLDQPNPDQTNATVLNFPMYFNNVEFPSSPGATARRQLDVSIRSNTDLDILFPPVVGAPNGMVGANELEPNDTPAQHNTVAIGATVSGTAEDVADTTDVPEDVAVRGDGIEDIFRFDAANDTDLRFTLTSSSSQNLDLYVVTGDLRVQNPTRQGTTRSSANEQICLTVPAGAHYMMVTNNDVSKSADADYDLTVEPDPQQITVEIDEPIEPVEVDAACDASIDFTVTIEDGCCVDPENLALVVFPSSPTNNATLGPVTTDPPQVLSPSLVTVTGRVAVTGITGCPAEVMIGARARDCAGNTILSLDTGGNDSTMVIDTLPPMPSTSVSVPLLEPPDASMRDVGFAGSAVDNCDAALPALSTSVWSDESEGGVFSPDAKQDAAGLWLRAERRAMGDGRVYLMTSSTSDACANAAAACVAAGVARDSSQESVDAVGDQMASAVSTCEANAGAAPPGFAQQGLGAEMGPKR